MSELSASPPSGMGRYLRLGLQGAILCILASTAVVLVTARPETWHYVSRFNWWLAPLVVALIFVAWLCNAARTFINARALGRRITFLQAFCVILSTEFGVASSPAGMGGAATRLYLLKQARVPLTTSASMLTADIVVDFALFGLLTPIAFYYILGDEGWSNLFARLPLWQLAIGGVVALVALSVAVVFFRTGAWSTVISAAARYTAYGREKRWPGRFRAFRMALRRSRRRFALITRFMFRKRRPALLANFGLATIQWLCRYGTLPLILLGFGTLENPFPLVVLQGMLFLFGVITFLPGGGGGVEVATAFMLSYFVPVPMVGIVLVLWRFATYHLYLIGGGAVFFYVTTHMRRVFPGSGRGR